MGGAGLGPNPGVPVGAEGVRGVGIFERLLRTRRATLATMATATMASIAIPVGEVRKAKKEVPTGWTWKRTFWSSEAFITLFHVAEFDVVLLGLGTSAGTTTFT